MPHTHGRGTEVVDAQGGSVIRTGRKALGGGGLGGRWELHCKAHAPHFARAWVVGEPDASTIQPSSGQGTSPNHG
jgi:hypothetical protein